MHALPRKKVKIYYIYKFQNGSEFNIKIQLGAAKDFEVVPKLRNVVALEDDQWEWEWEDDDWERIYNEQHATEKMSYSYVLKGLKEDF